MSHASEGKSSAVIDPLPELRGDEPSIYRVGTLSYTKRGLGALFLWLLVGDFCFTLKEIVMPKLLPLVLKSNGATGAQIGLIVTSIPALLGMVLAPIISYRSDRFRSRMGRRIPFILFATPPVGLCLIFAGFSPQIAGWVHSRVIPTAWEISYATVILWTLGSFFALFMAFNMVAGTVFGLLINDVVPRELMGRFYGWFRVVMAGATLMFNWFLFGLADTHARGIFVGIGIVYSVAFLALCLRVREGEYPPPPPPLGRNWGMTIIGYLRDSFGTPIYAWMFTGFASVTMGGVCFGLFSIFYGFKLGLTLESYSKVLVAISLGNLVISAPIGYLADRFHPLRMEIAAFVLMTVISVLAFFFIVGVKSFIFFELAISFAGTMWATSWAPLCPALLPKDRYGQFLSAANVLGMVVSMVGGYVGGKFMDVMDDYRYMYLWSLAFGVLSVISMAMVMHHVKRNGGLKHYVAP
jgi:MFS family permease